MIDADKRKAVFLLHQEGMGARELSRRLGLGRNTVRRAIALEGGRPRPGTKSTRSIRNSCGGSTRSARGGSSGYTKNSPRKRAWRSRIRR